MQPYSESIVKGVYSPITSSIWQ